MALSEQIIYGLARIGAYKPQRNQKLPETDPNRGKIMPILVGQLTLGYKSYELSNHLGNVLTTISDNKMMVQIPASETVSAQVYLQAIVLTTQDYYPFGMPMKERGFSNVDRNSQRFGFNTQEKDLDIDQGGSHYTAEFWEYDGRTGRRWNIDPVVKVWESPYACLGNSPIMMSDINGDDAKGNPPKNKLTGSKNLLIFINEEAGKADSETMNNTSGKWDYIFVDNMKEAQQVLSDHYGKKTDFIQNLVIRSHGSVPYGGPDLDKKDGTGVLHDPSKSKDLKYIRSLLTKDANVLLTACSIVQMYLEEKDRQKRKEYIRIARETAANYSKFFLKGSKRNLFLNHTQSMSYTFENNDYSYVLDKDDNLVLDKDGNPIGTLTDGDTYTMRFNQPLVGATWSGFIWYHYNQGTTWVRQPTYYNVSLQTEGGFKLHRMVAIPQKSQVVVTDDLNKGLLKD